jgi:Flp pilus assembly protein TadG
VIGHRAERGQATVELALTLPVLAAVLLAIVQVGLIARDDVLVLHAAREAARQAALGASDGAVRHAALAAGPLDPSRVTVGTARAGDVVTVTIVYRIVPMITIMKPFIAKMRLEGHAAMAQEN